MTAKLLTLVLTTTAIATSCSPNTFKTPEVNTVSAFNNTPTICEEISNTNGYIEWCNFNSLNTSDVSDVCSGVAYVTGQYRKILKLETYGQASKCYMQFKTEKKIYIPECDSAYEQIYNSLADNEQINVYECRQNQIGILYLHATKNLQKLFTVFPKK